MAQLNFLFDLKAVKDEIITVSHVSKQRGLTKSAINGNYGFKLVTLIWLD